MESIWHIGIAVPDLDKGKKELGEVFGLDWRPVRGAAQSAEHRKQEHH